jgi:hypothetical protein
MVRRVSNGLEREKEGEEGNGSRGRETGRASQLGLGRVWAAGKKKKERRERREVGRGGWIGRKMEWVAGRKRKRGFDLFFSFFLFQPLLKQNSQTFYS